jgi:hypothetical protein
MMIIKVITVVVVVVERERETSAVFAEVVA